MTDVLLSAADRPRVGRGALAGLLSAAAALAVAEMVTAALGGGSPVLAVGGTFVDATPRWLKEFAISSFGQHDKSVLLVGIGVTIALLAAGTGVLSQWWPAAGVTVAAGLWLVPALAASTRPGGNMADAVPSLLGACVGAGCLWLFSRESTAFQRSRRSFLLVAGVTAAVAVTGGVLAKALRRTQAQVEALRTALRLPAPADPSTPAPRTLPVAGLSPFRTPNREFYRVDTALSVPYVDPRTWRLRIHGLVESDWSLSLDDLLAMPLVERDITLTCVSNEVGGNLVGNARWLGVPLRRILDGVGPAAAADQVVSRSVDGMTIGSPLRALLDGRDALLAVGMNGEPLPVEHGFPVRMVVPGLYGYVSACKWIAEMELTTFGTYDAYWVQRGWAQQAPIRLSSRIDTPRAGSSVSGEVSVAGVAWAQNVGIGRVEVRVDGGDWHAAELGGDGGVDSWRQWVWSWQAATPGEHTLQVRAHDLDGQAQIGTEHEPFPSGSTGWHAVRVTVD